MDAVSRVPWVDEFPLLISGGDGAKLLQLAEAALDGVAFAVVRGVEGRRAASARSTVPGS